MKAGASAKPYPERRRNAGRMLAWIGGVLAGAWLALSAGLFWAMSQPPDRFGAIMARFPMPLMLVLPFETLWNHARGGNLEVGDQAADFRLPLLNQDSAVQLASLRGVRPVVLVFGSYT